MPRAALKPCSYPGCIELVERGRCEQHRQPRPDAYRDPERQRLYGRKWRARRRVWLTEHPWCETCMLAGHYTPATDVHHLERHEGNVETFNSSPLQSLCHACHSSVTLREVRRG